MAIFRLFICIIFVLFVLKIVFFNKNKQGN